MMEKVTLQMSQNGQLHLIDGVDCNEMNPKELLLHAAARCAALTVLMILKKERLSLKQFTISYSGELSEDSPYQTSVFTSFHAYYRAECPAEEQARVSRTLERAHDKYCSLVQMLRKIAPVTHEIEVVGHSDEN